MNDNENKTNAPIKLPVRYDETTFCVHDTEKIICVVDVDATMPDNLANALGNQIVAALNEANALRAEVEGLRKDAERLCMKVTSLLLPDLTGAEADIRDTANRLLAKIDKARAKDAAIKPNAAAGEEGTE